MQNILVVEDDHDLNQAICYSLKKSGYESGAEEVIENRIWILGIISDYLRKV